MKVAHLTTTDLTLRYLLLGQLTRLREEGYEVTAISAPGPNTAAIEAAGVRPRRHGSVDPARLVRQASSAAESNSSLASRSAAGEPTAHG